MENVSHSQPTRKRITAVSDYTKINAEYYRRLIQADKYSFVGQPSPVH